MVAPDDLKANSKLSLDVSFAGRVRFGFEGHAMIQMHLSKILAAPSLLLALGLTGTALAQNKIIEFSEKISRGATSPIYMFVCDSLFCQSSLCFTVRDTNLNAIKSEYHVETLTNKYDEKRRAIHGEHCTKKRWMTYLMYYTVYVTATDGDTIVEYKTFDADKSR